MGAKSSIEWTDSTWNPVTGCNKVSAGCTHCYAERLAKRLRAMGNPRYRKGFDLALHWDLLDLPLSWKIPRMVFVASMSDMFHPDVPDAFIQRAFTTMQSAHWHIFQVLTKRPERMAKMSSRLIWPENVWAGTSVENEDCIHRVTWLTETPAAVRFLSLEPLLGGIPTLPLAGIDWVIAGGESGPHARPMNAEWVRLVRDQCIDNKVCFFFKQWGGRNKKAAGRVLDGQIWDEMPSRERITPESLVAVGD